MKVNVFPVTNAGPQFWWAGSLSLYVFISQH